MCQHVSGGISTCGWVFQYVGVSICGWMFQHVGDQLVDMLNVLEYKCAGMPVVMLTCWCSCQSVVMVKCEYANLRLSVPLFCNPNPFLL